MLKQKCYRVTRWLKTPQLTPAFRGKLQPLSIPPALACPHSSPLTLPRDTCSPDTVISWMLWEYVVVLLVSVPADSCLWSEQKMWERKRRKASRWAHYHSSCCVPRDSLRRGPSGKPPEGLPDFSTQRTRVKSISWWILSLLRVVPGALIP